MPRRVRVDSSAMDEAVAHVPWQNELSRRVWDTRYRQRSIEGLAERSLGETWERVATALAATEPTRQQEWRAAFRALLDDFAFLPGGRILAGAGAATETTLANCFVAGTLDDSLDVVFARLRESALTMQWGGGVGIDFSTLKPRGAGAAGPLAYMRIWDVTCESLSGIGARRGAMMATLRCDHPDIEEFIEAKRDPAQLRNFNLSVLVTDEFMAALAAGRDWPLCFPSELPSSPALVKRWPGFGTTSCTATRLLPARELWKKLVAAAYDVAEPGVLFIDRINRANNLYYREELVATNPCGEIPLPPHGACVLGSINLPLLVRDAFGPRAQLDFAALEDLAAMAVRLLDDAVEAAVYPLTEQAEQARATRRIGLGVTGLADALILLGLRYDEPAGRALASAVLERVRDAAYGASVDLAAEKGSFPLFERDAYLGGEFVGRLPASLRERIARDGIRNSHLLAIAPAGTISLLANNVSSGVEPVFALESERRVVDAHGAVETHRVADYAYVRWRETHAEPPPATFVVAEELAPAAHLEMVAALQPLVDGAIAKTINVAATLPQGELESVFERAYTVGLKGCTVFRPNPVTGSVLTSVTRRCCRAGIGSH